MVLFHHFFYFTSSMLLAPLSMHIHETQAKSNYKYIRPIPSCTSITSLFSKYRLPPWFELFKLLSDIKNCSNDVRAKLGWFNNTCLKVAPLCKTFYTLISPCHELNAQIYTCGEKEINLKLFSQILKGNRGEIAKRMMWNELTFPQFWFHHIEFSACFILPFLTEYDVIVSYPCRTIVVPHIKPCTYQISVTQAPSSWRWWLLSDLWILRGTEKTRRPS